MSVWRCGGDSAWEAAYRHCPSPVREWARTMKPECLTGGFTKEPGFTGEIYEISRNNRLLYVGSTTRGADRRWKEWVSKAKSGNDHPLCEEIRQFGVDGFEVCVLPFHCGSEDEMRNMETYFIDCYKKRGVAIYNTRNAFHKSQPSKKERAFNMSSEEFKNLAGID